ncbi:MAG: tyrosine-type recombinase/integrase [Planctomycetota bacterium]
MASVYRTKDRAGKPHRAWRFKYRDHTGRWRYGTGWPDKRKTLDHALALEAECRAIRNGEKPVPPSWLRERNRPIAEVIAAYLAWGKAQGGRRGHGWSKDHAEKRKIGLQYWTRELGLKTLADIDLAAVESKARELLGSGLTGKTVSGYVESLKALCTWAARRKLLQGNPLAGMRGFNLTPKCPHRALTDGEVQRLLQVAPPARSLLYRTALATGYRAGELRALRVRYLDVFGPFLNLPGEYTNNRRDARQPIARELADELQAVAKGKAPDSPLLGMPHKETANENLQRDCAKAGIRRVTNEGKATFHSFRVNYINAVVESGSDLKTIMTLARHGSAQMSMEVYAKPKPERLRAAARAVADRLEEVISADTCCAYVAREVGAETTRPVSPEPVGAYGPQELASPRGFEPRSPD